MAGDTVFFRLVATPRTLTAPATNSVTTVDRDAAGLVVLVGRGAWTTTELKSRPRGSFSIVSVRIEVVGRVTVSDEP